MQVWLDLLLDLGNRHSQLDHAYIVDAESPVLFKGPINIPSIIKKPCVLHAAWFLDSGYACTTTDPSEGLIHSLNSNFTIAFEKSTGKEKTMPPTQRPIRRQLRVVLSLARPGNHIKYHRWPEEGGKGIFFYNALSKTFHFVHYHLPAFTSRSNSFLLVFLHYNSIHTLFISVLCTHLASKAFIHDLPFLPPIFSIVHSLSNLFGVANARGLKRGWGPHFANSSQLSIIFLIS